MKRLSKKVSKYIQESFLDFKFLIRSFNFAIDRLICCFLSSKDMPFVKECSSHFATINIMADTVSCWGERFSNCAKTPGKL